MAARVVAVGFQAMVSNRLCGFLCSMLIYSGCLSDNASCVVYSAILFMYVNV